MIMKTANVKAIAGLMIFGFHDAPGDSLSFFTFATTKSTSDTRAGAHALICSVVSAEMRPAQLRLNADHTSKFAQPVRLSMYAT